MLSIETPPQKKNLEYLKSKISAFFDFKKQNKTEHIFQKVDIFLELNKLLTARFLLQLTAMSYTIMSCLCIVIN